MEKSKFVFYSLIAAFGAFVAGMNLGGISGAIDAVSAEFGLNALMKGFVTSSLMAGCLFGALSGGSLSDKFGRKAILTVSEILLLVSAVGCGFFSHGAWPLVVYRFLAGLGVGALSAVIPAYISEISVARWRGTLVSLYQVFVVIGILAAYTANYFLV